jgi:uncharacterized protein YndB with AHSA1/START domain
MSHSPAISITHHFDASPERVFDAWTDPEKFAQWFGTSAETIEAVELDVREGGAWCARMHLDTGEVEWTGSYTTVDRPVHLAFTISDNPDGEHENVDVVLEADDDGTEMTFTQFGGNLTEEQYVEAATGWRSFFEDLAAVIGAA